MILPRFRTSEYTTWAACERLGILPPDCKPLWDENDVYTQAAIIGYGMIRDKEESEQE